jgi:type II secretory ATPase GspE/PulE/Tfp pilus assembly ATPase PilB-like protein
MDVDFKDESSALPLPESFVEKTAIDTLKRTVYVERTSAGDPVLLTWVDRNRSRGIVFTVKPVEFDEVVRLRNSGLRQAEESDVDMKVKAEAIEIIKTAARYRAHDLHFNLRGSHTEIQIGVNGGLRVLAQKTQQDGEALTRAIYQGIAKVRDASYNILDVSSVSGGSASPGIWAF